MNILVCIKQVPDTKLSLKIGKDGKGIDPEGVEYVVNPYDEYAIEEALRQKEARGGKVTLLAFGPERVQKTLRSALAMGADEAVHVQCEATSDCDPLRAAAGAAKAIAHLAAEGETFDLVWTGKVAVDSGFSAFGPALAEHLGRPCVTEVKKVTLAADGASLTAERDIEGGSQVLCASLPAVLTADKGLNEPRYASLKNIMLSKKKPLKVLGMDHIGGTCDPSASRLEVLSCELPPEKTAKRIMIGGDVAAQVKEAVRLLREDARVI